jgi:hypothetical protein
VHDDRGGLRWRRRRDVAEPLAGARSNASTNPNADTDPDAHTDANTDPKRRDDVHDYIVGSVTEERDDIPWHARDVHQQ